MIQKPIGPQKTPPSSYRDVFHYAENLEERIEKVKNKRCTKVAQMTNIGVRKKKTFFFSYFKPIQNKFKKKIIHLSSGKSIMAAVYKKVVSNQCFGLSPYFEKH